MDRDLATAGVPVSGLIDRRALIATGLALAATGTALADAGTARADAPATPSAAADRLNALLADLAREKLVRSPESATELGLDVGDLAGLKGLLDARTLSARADDLGRIGDQLRRLRALDRGSLTGLDALNYDSVAWQLGEQDRDRRAFAYGTGDPCEPYVLSQLTGAYQSVPDLLDVKHTIRRPDDVEAYMARLETLGAVLDGELEAARHDAGLGIVPPASVVERTLEQLRMAAAEPSDTATVVASVARRAREAGLPGDPAFRAAALHREQVGPAFRRQVSFLETLAGRPGNRPGIADLPDGEARYRAALRGGTSTDVSPADVHRLGLDRSAALTGALDAAFRARDLTRGTVGERLRALFEDARFLYPNTDDGKARLVADLNGRIAGVAARIPDWFGTLPRSPVEVRRVPPAIEAAGMSNYQSGSLDGTRPGTYYLALRDTAELPSWVLPTLTYHETIPGHHMAISLANEAALPLVRKLAIPVAYAEGWAFYAEQLADEMGLYADDPLGRIGFLHDALLRAVRLVVDTGLHAFGWSRERAVRHMVDTLGDPNSAAEAEVDRYCACPGQACGYTVGHLAFTRLRDVARARLGPRFDVKRFHDVCLLNGPMHLGLLEEVVDAYARS